jgi:hypothetical protein
VLPKRPLVAHSYLTAMAAVLISVVVLMAFRRVASACSTLLGPISCAALALFLAELARFGLIGRRDVVDRQLRGREPLLLGQVLS